MRRSSALVLAIAMAVILSVPFVPMNAEAQMATDMVTITTDYELLGFSDLHGGGHLTYELTGQAAGDLRRAVLDRYDGLITGTANGRIDPAELKMNEQTGYIADVESSLATTSFFSATTNRYEPLHEGQGEDITADAQGFYEVTNIGADDSTPIRIYLYFDATRMSMTELNFALLSRDLVSALYSPFTNSSSGAITSSDIRVNDYTFRYKHTDYRICVGSLSGQSLTTEGGTMHVVRTPAGEISTYTVTFDYNDRIMDEADYHPFSFLESPQVLFVLVFICTYLISTMPTRMYANYKYAYPRRFRHKALKITWLHITSKLTILLLILFYFFPTLFAFISPSFFMSGLFIWLMGIGLAVTFSVLAKVLYDKLANNIPEDHLKTPVRKIAPRAPQPTTTSPAGFNVTVQQGGAQQPRQRQIARQPAAAPAPAEPAKPAGPPCKVCEKPITDFVDLLKCKCGSLFHENCAEIAEHCTSCGNALVEIEPEGPVMRDIQCPTCGEMNSIEDNIDLLTVKCAACGVILEKLDEGYNYLVVSNEHKDAFEMFVSMLKSGCTGLSISTTFPDKLRKEHDMAQSEVVWLTDTSVADKKTINPHRLEFEMMRMYASFVKGNPKSVIILDGFEYLVVENGFDKVFKFIKKINDLSSVNSATLFVPIGTDSLEPDQLGTLKKEFDKVMDMTDD